MDDIQAIVDELGVSRTLTVNILTDRCVQLRRELTQLQDRNKVLIEQNEKQAEELAELKKPTLTAVG